MADKKTNEIIEEQRRARQEFLNLKKMQQGEMYAGPKPSETATVLATPKDKFKNFWDYSKWYVISGIALAALIAFLVVQCATKPAYDLKVVFFTYDAVLDEQLSPAAEFLSKYAEDINGDGQANVQIINCSISDKNTNVTMRNTALQKIQSIIVAEPSALLFILDEKSVKYFDNLDSGINSMFDENPVLLGEDFYESTKHENFGTLPKDLTLYCRKVSGTMIEKNKEISKYYDASRNIITAIDSQNGK